MALHCTTPRPLPGLPLRVARLTFSTTTLPLTPAFFAMSFKGSSGPASRCRRPPAEQAGECITRHLSHPSN